MNIASVIPLVIVQFTLRNRESLPVIENYTCSNVLTLYRLKNQCNEDRCKIKDLKKQKALLNTIINCHNTHVNSKEKHGRKVSNLGDEFESTSIACCFDLIIPALTKSALFRGFSSATPSQRFHAGDQYAFNYTASL